MGLNEFFN